MGERRLTPGEAFKLPAIKMVQLPNGMPGVATPDGNVYNFPCLVDVTTTMRVDSYIAIQLDMRLMPEHLLYPDQIIVTDGKGYDDLDLG